MAVKQPGTFTTDSTAAVNVVLTEEANRIGSDIHRQTLHTSPWIDLIKKSAFPDGMGYTLNTLIYDRALPLKGGDLLTPGVDGDVGVNWNPLGAADASSLPGFTDGQLTSKTTEVPINKIDFTQVLKSYSLKRAVVESPRINIEDLRFAAHRNDQLRAIVDLLKESTRNSWEERYRDEYDRLADNAIACKSSGTMAGLISGVSTLQSFGENAAALPATTKLGDVGGATQTTITANISNKILDEVYFRLVRRGAGQVAYGRENGRPVFSLVCSSEASHQLMTEAGYRDDVRYNNSRVSELIAPLGVEKSFRGFYHLVDDLATRYSYDGTQDTLLRVPPYVVSPSLDTVIPNDAYDSAQWEAAYVLVDNVMESLVPAPLSGGGGLKFDPVQYTGDFKWTNIPDIKYNPDGTLGYFRGIMASASKPIKTEFGYVIIFDRTSTTPAA